jgi:dolichol-phosphate mannosyltransferase
MSERCKVSVVLPVYRTGQYLHELYDRLVAVLTDAAGDFELILVDDGSPDGAWAVITELARHDRRVKGIRLSRNFGQHPAICAGFEHATGDLVVLMDADLQDRPEDIPLLMQQLKDDCDVVYTVKEGVTEPPLVRWTSRLYHAAITRLTGVAVPRNVGTFRLFTRRMLRALLAYPEYNVLYGPLMFHVGFGSAVVPVPRAERRGGRSSYSFRKRLALAVNSLLSYTDFPHRFLVSFGGLIFVLSVLYAIALCVRYLVARDAVPPGLTLLALLITLSLGSLMMGLGIIGMYVFRVYQEVLHRPRYIAARTLNLEEEHGA